MNVFETTEELKNEINEINKAINELKYSCTIELNQLKDEIINKYVNAVMPYDAKRKKLEKKYMNYLNKIVNKSYFDAVLISNFIASIISEKEQIPYIVDTPIIIGKSKKYSIINKYNTNNNNCISLYANNKNMVKCYDVNGNTDVRIPEKFKYINDFIISLLKYRIDKKDNEFNNNEMCEFVLKYIKDIKSNQKVLKYVCED